MAAVISPVTGTRTEPKDTYVFVKGTSATFKTIFTSDGVPITVDIATAPTADILQPRFLNQSGSPVPEVLATLTGTLVPGQQFEYQFVWNIPLTVTPIDEYIISYKGSYGSMLLNFGDEFFAVSWTSGQVGMKSPSYATVADVRNKKFNIDDYLPVVLKSDLTARNNLIESHLRDAASRLREELNLTKQKGNTENYRLFCIYYTVWSIMLGSRGEDGNSISDTNLLYWRTEYDRILAQLKRQSVLQGIPLGRG
jgi:hypothetical protein